MPEFQYSAMDAAGKVVHGTLQAVDKSDLSRQLQLQGLFLVSWTAPGESAPAEAPALAEATREDSLPRTDDLFSNGRPLTLKQRAALAAILLSGVLAGVWGFYTQRHPAETAGTLNHLMLQLRPGMTRSAVEQIFTKPAPGCPDPHKSCYAVPPNFIVQIGYNSQGGAGSAENRVRSDDIRIVRSGPFNKR